MKKTVLLGRDAILMALVFGVALWSYWPTLLEMARRWSVEPAYSHGYVVPCFALLLLWARRDQLDRGLLKPSWWGLVFVLVATSIRLLAAFFAIHSPDRFSLIPIFIGICVSLGGWHALRWAWPSIAFLVFMIPLPAGLDRVLARPLQSLATLSSAFLLQTMGFVAEAEGNVIVLPGGELGIVEACSGLRMFMTFCALSTALAIVSSRSLIQRLLILASAFPLAMICNVVRITMTGIIHETLGAAAAQVLFHDLAGWFMIALALGLLLLELKFLSRLFVPVKEDDRPFLQPMRKPERPTSAPLGA
jgi:exosortase